MKNMQLNTQSVIHVQTYMYMCSASFFIPMHIITDPCTFSNIMLAGDMEKIQAGADSFPLVFFKLFLFATSV